MVVIRHGNITCPVMPPDSPTEDFFSSCQINRWEQLFRQRLSDQCGLFSLSRRNSWTLKPDIIWYMPSRRQSRVQHGMYQLFYVATAEQSGDPTKIKNPAPKPQTSGDHPMTNTYQNPLLNHNFFYTTMQAASISSLLVINTIKGIPIPVGLLMSTRKLLWSLSRQNWIILAFSSFASLARAQLFNRCSLALKWRLIAVLVDDNELLRQRWVLKHRAEALRILTLPLVPFGPKPNRHSVLTLPLGP